MNEVALYFFAAIVILAIVWMVIAFNALTMLNNQCREAWSKVDAELKRRYDLIPNLVTVVTAYARPERETLESVTRARDRAISSTGSPASQAQDENVLVVALRQLFVVAERYPALKADGHFLKVQQELVDVEERIQEARRSYNANVRDFNTRLEAPLSNLIARLSGFSPEVLFEIQEAGIHSAPPVDVS